MFRPREGETPGEPGRDRLGREDCWRAGTTVRLQNPGRDERSATRRASRIASYSRSKRLKRRPSKDPAAFNAHSPRDRGSGLVQPVFRSPARISDAESTRYGPCAAPPSEKR
jgi:hypothetical protein